MPLMPVATAAAPDGPLSKFGPVSNSGGTKNYYSESDNYPHIHIKYSGSTWLYIGVTYGFLIRSGERAGRVNITLVSNNRANTRGRDRAAFRYWLKTTKGVRATTEQCDAIWEILNYVAPAVEEETFDVNDEDDFPPLTAGT